ncbi:MAG: hypothetical protein ACRESQ_04445 [Gammaproteobacteria bacterium]
MDTLKVIPLVLLLLISLSAFGANHNVNSDLFYVPPSAPRGTIALLEKAAGLALKNTDCVKVIGGAWSTRKEASEEAPFKSEEQFYIQCESNQPGPVPGAPAVFNLYYGYKDLHTSMVKERPKPISDNTAISECKQAILNRLKFPSSARMSLVRFGANGTDNNLVVYNFTALNGFGNRIPQKGSCVITPGNQIDVDITNR